MLQTTVKDFRNKYSCQSFYRYAPRCSCRLFKGWFQEFLINFSESSFKNSSRISIRNFSRSFRNNLSENFLKSYLGNPSEIVSAFLFKRDTLETTLSVSSGISQVEISFGISSESFLGVPLEVHLKIHSWNLGKPSKRVHII